MEPGSSSAPFVTEWMSCSTTSVRQSGSRLWHLPVCLHSGSCAGCAPWPAQLEFWVARQLKGARSLDEVAEVDTVAAGLLAEIEHRGAEREVVSGRSSGQRRPDVGAGGGRLATLLALADHGSRERPGPALERHGLAEDWPWPTSEPSGKRRRGSTPETRGAVVYDDTPWSDLAVRAILGHAIDAERSRAHLPYSPCANSVLGASTLV